jgi:UDP-glucose 4-epimerase
MNVDGKTILITGGTGSFGTYMTQRLLNTDVKKIIIFSRDEDKQRMMKSSFNSDKLKFLIGDVRDYEKIDDSLRNVDIILHAGALKQIPSVEFYPMEAIKTNAISSYNILKASAKNNVSLLIGISTDKAVKPVNSYGISKAMMEKILIGDDIDSDVIHGCVRYGNVLGSRGSVLPVWDQQIKEKKPISITSDNMRRFFITLHEATDLIFHSINKMKKGEIIVRHAPSCFIKDLALAYAELITGDKNYPLNIIGIRAGEKTDELLISQEESKKTFVYSENYYHIRRYDHISTHDPSYRYHDMDYSSATTDILSRNQIKSLLQNTTWQK